MNDKTALASAGSAIEPLAAGRPATAGWWWLLCGSMVAAMAALRLTIYPDKIVPLTYALPLLVCLWNRDLRLLWGMAGAFVGIVALKFVLAMPEGDLTPQSEWIFGGMQLANILIAAGVIHLVIRLTGRLATTITVLEKTNAELDASNEELSAREEEITQQNEELQCQAEELEQQTEELNTQTEELQTLNEQLAARERTVGELLESFAGGADEREMLAKLGEMVMRLFGERISAAAVLEAQGDSMVVRPLTGIPSGVQRLKRSRTLADLVFTRDRAGFLADLTLRPDLEAPALPGGARVRSLAAAPFRVADAVTGALEIYRTEPGEWSEQDLRIVQWLAEQCGRTWTTVRLRDALDHQRRLLRTVTETSSVALFMVDEDELCTYANRAAEELLGYPLKELQQRPLHELIRARTGGEAEAFVSVRIDEQGQEPQDDIFIRKGGGEVPVRVVCSSVESGGRVTGKVIEVRDATELNRHEEEREQLLEAERQARAEAERANRTKDEFVATLSHELRTPLNAMMGWASLLRKSDCSDVAEVQQGLEIIERNARQQGQLISDLLDISRITAGKIRLDIQAVDVPLVIESALEAVRPAAEAKGVRLERVVETLDRAVTGDPNRLQQVVWNLLSNAIKFTPRDGRVQVVVSRVASYVQITVSDSGEGIDPELLPHLFERYRQADGSSTRRHSGLGLGLAIAKHLVELHGGSIHARSDGLGAGAAFSVLLPVRAAEPHQSVNGPHPRAESARPWDGPAPDLDGVAVLVVDDEQDARDLIRRVLRERGASVACAASAEEALDLLAVDPPGMLVSDIGMPGMDGYTLIRTIHERWPHLRQKLPAIALTAFARSEDRTRALLAGFRAHVAKPVDSAELVATVAALRIVDHNQSNLRKRSK